MIEPLRSWLDVLGCPSCVWANDGLDAGALELQRRTLVCRDCGTTYPEVDGVVRLLTPEHTSGSWDQPAVFFDDVPEMRSTRLPARSLGGAFASI